MLEQGPLNLLKSSYNQPRIQSIHLYLKFFVKSEYISRPLNLKLPTGSQVLPSYTSKRQLLPILWANYVTSQWQWAKGARVA